MIDEAHAVGVVGPRGAGLAAEMGLENAIDVQIGTLSKAIGAYGAYVAGSKVLIDFLINRARSFIYTTGLPPSIAAAAETGVDIIASEPQRIRRLWDNASHLRKQLEAAGLRSAARTRQYCRCWSAMRASRPRWPAGCSSAECM